MLIMFEKKIQFPAHNWHLSNYKKRLWSFDFSLKSGLRDAIIGMKSWSPRWQTELKLLAKIAKELMFLVKLLAGNEAEQYIDSFIYGKL